MFVVLASIPVCNNNIIVTKLFAEICECSKKHEQCNVGLFSIIDAAEYIVAALHTQGTANTSALAAVRLKDSEILQALYYCSLKRPLCLHLALASQLKPSVSSASVVAALCCLTDTSW